MLLHGTTPSNSGRSFDELPRFSELDSLVQTECRAESNRFGASFYDEHIAVVMDFAARLAPRFGANLAIVQLASLLHDRAAILDFANLRDHATEGARLARELLGKRQVDPSVIDGVALAIATHSSPLLGADATPEQRCLASADLMSHIARPRYWFFYLHCVRSLDFAGARAWYQARLELVPLLPRWARELIDEPLARVRWLLEDPVPH